MTNTVRLAVCAALALSLAPGAFAADPPASPAASQQAAMKMPVPATADFLIKVATGNKFEIASSKLALTRSKSESVQAFAKMMVGDHGNAAARMKQAVSEAKLSPPPDALEARHRATLDELAGKEGPAFDKAYLDAQLKGHEETVALFEAYADGGDNARIKQFAKDLLPTLQKHLEHVRTLKS